MASARDEVRRPLGAVAASAVEGLRTLVRQQLELVKIELVEALSARAAAVGMMVGAAVLVVYAVGYLTGAVAAALALVMPRWAAELLVAVLLIGGAAALVLIGRHTFLKAPKAELTQEMLKEDARWAKQQIAR